CALGRVAFAPTVSRESPAQFKSRPARGIHKANSPDQISGGFLLDGPDAVAAKIPVADNGGHLPPGVRCIHWFSFPEKPHDLGVKSHFAELFKVIFPKPAQA